MIDEILRKTFVIYSFHFFLHQSFAFSRECQPNYYHESQFIDDIKELVLNIAAIKHTEFTRSQLVEEIQFWCIENG